MTDRHALNAIHTTVQRWEADPRYRDSEAMRDVARIVDDHFRMDQSNGDQS